MATRSSATEITVNGDLQQKFVNQPGIHTDDVYNALLKACHEMEDKLANSLKAYQEHPDVQANLQQLQYDLAQWNLALTTMTNINKTMADGLSAIASNFR